MSSLSQAKWAHEFLRHSLHLVDSIFKLYDSRDKVLEPIRDVMCRFVHHYMRLLTATTQELPLSFLWSKVPKSCSCTWWVVRYMVPWLHGVSSGDDAGKHKGNHVMHKLWPIWEQYAWQPWQIQGQYYHKSWHCASRSQQVVADTSSGHDSQPLPPGEFPEHVCSFSAVIAMLLWNIMKRRKKDENPHLRLRSKDLLQSLLTHFLPEVASIPVRLDVDHVIGTTPLQEPHVSVLCGKSSLCVQVHVQPELEAQTLLLRLRSSCADCNSSSGTLPDLLVMLAQSRQDWLVAQLLFGIEVAVCSTHDFALYSTDAFDAPTVPKCARQDAHLVDQVGLLQADELGGGSNLCKAAARFAKFSGKYNAVWEQKASVE